MKRVLRTALCMVLLLSTMLTLCPVFRSEAEASASRQGTETEADERKRLAQEILDTEGISLWKSNDSKEKENGGKQDNAHATQNIIDTANGLPAQRSDYENAKTYNKKHPDDEKKVELSVDLLHVILALKEKYGKLSISAIAGSSHSKDSAHYRGKAVDVTWVEKSGGLSKNKGKEIYKYLTELGYELGGFSKSHFNTWGVVETYKDKKGKTRWNHYHIQISGYKGVKLGYALSGGSGDFFNQRDRIDRPDVARSRGPGKERTTAAGEHRPLLEICQRDALEI